MRYQSARPRRQFLAGVSCPQCDSKDAIVQVQIFTPEPDEYIECTDCGHREHRPSAEKIKQRNAELDSTVTNAGIRVVSFNQ